jgi:hypothetical protein
MSQLSAAIQLKKKNIQHHRPALAAYPYAPEKFLLCSFLQLFRPTHAARPSLAHTIVHTFAHLLNISRLRIHNEQHRAQLWPLGPFNRQRTDDLATQSTVVFSVRQWMEVRPVERLDEQLSKGIDY